MAIPEKYRIVYLQTVYVLGGIPTATVKLDIDGHISVGVETGEGTVHAVFKTIDSLVKNGHTLEDYEVSGISGGADALAKVTIKLKSKSGAIYLGTAKNVDTIGASASAYINALNRLMHFEPES